MEKMNDWVTITSNKKKQQIHTRGYQLNRVCFKNKQKGIS